MCQQTQALIDKSARTREARKILGFRQMRKLYCQIDCEIEFQLDQPAAHERTEIIAPDEFLERRILILKCLAAHPPSQLAPDVVSELADVMGNGGERPAVAIGVDRPAIAILLHL